MHCLNCIRCMQNSTFETASLLRLHFMALAEVFHLYTINTDFLLDYLFRICIITRMLTDARQLQRKASNDGPLFIRRPTKERKQSLNL